MHILFFEFSQELSLFHAFRVSDRLRAWFRQQKKDKKEKKRPADGDDQADEFQIKPDKSVPTIDTSKWPLLLKVRPLPRIACAQFLGFFDFELCGACAPVVHGLSQLAPAAVAPRRPIAHAYTHEPCCIFCVV